MGFYAFYIKDKTIVYTSSGDTEKALQQEGYKHIFSASTKHMYVFSPEYKIIPGREWDGDVINTSTAWYD